MPASLLGASDLRLLERFWRQPASRCVLPNGATVLLQRDDSAALASVQVWVKTGSIHEGACLGAGLSHYLEHMLFKGTSRRTGREISTTVQAHGGYINAYTAVDRTVYHVDLPSEHVGVAIKLLADIVLHSALPEGEAAKEKEVILREIAMTQDDPDDRLWRSLFSTAFREHPYRHPVIGHRDVFSTAGREDLAAYYHSRYVPENLVVIVVGDIDIAAARAAIEAQFGSVARARLAPVLVPGEPGQLAPRSEHRFEKVELTRAAVAWRVPGLAHVDAPVLDLLAIVLGHGESSVLWQELREKAGLVHTIDAACWNPGTIGLFCVSFTCDADKRARATQALERILRRSSAAGFAPRQLKKALRQLVAGEIAAHQTMSGQAARLGDAEVVVGDLDYRRSYFERLGSVDRADLKRVIRTYLVPTGRTSVSLNPSSSAKAMADGAAGESAHWASGEAPGPATPFSAASAKLKVEQTVLSNGSRLLIQRDSRLPNLHLRLFMAGGPAYDPPGRSGATALLANLLTKDTKRRSAAAVAQFIEEVGGSFYPFLGNSSLGVAIEVLPPDSGRAIELMAEAMLQPAFLPSAFTVERDAQLAALAEDADDVVTEARKLVRRRFFGRHPLALDAQGEEAGVRSLDSADLVALHRRLAVAPNVVLSVAGEMPRGLEAKLKTFLGKLPRRTFEKAGAASAVKAAADDLPANPGDFVEIRPREQAVVLQAFPAPPAHTPDYYVGEVADELFSGMASRLFERVREEKALAYFVRSTRVTGLDAAMFCFLAGTQPGREAEVLAEIEAEIARVQSGGVEEAELGRCHARLKAARRQSLQSSSSRAFQAGLNVLQGQPAEDWKNYDARIGAVTAADLARFASTYFQRNRRTQLIVRPN